MLSTAPSSRSGKTRNNLAAALHTHTHHVAASAGEEDRASLAIFFDRVAAAVPQL